MIFLETKRLRFRSHLLEDESDFVSMQMDPAFRRYVGGKPRTYEDSVRRFRAEYVGEPSKTYGLWATVLKEENRYIGYCGLNAKGEHYASLAYYLGQPYWLRGFATEASVAFINLGFSQLHLTRLVAGVEAGNDVSEHILVKLGFVFASEEQIPGRTFHHYQLLREDWLQSELANE